MRLQTFMVGQVGHELQSLQADLDRAQGWTAESWLAEFKDRVTVTQNAIRSFVQDAQAHLERAGSLKGVSDAEFNAGGVRKVWHFFRDRFKQREDPELRTPLVLADELAWSCYRPFFESAATPPVKLQPVVHVSAEASPFALPRGQRFLPQQMGKRELDDERLFALTRRMPVPMIGIPWFQLRHLPQAPVIAHEVGHLVEEDFGLRADVKAVVAAAKLSNPSLWRAWRRECFADFVGAATMGAAYAQALIGYLADDPALVDKDAATAEFNYPPRHVRVHFVVSVLNQLRLDLPTSVRGLWFDTYECPTSLTPLLADAEKFAAALADMRSPRMGGTRLADIGPLKNQAEAIEVADRYLGNIEFRQDTEIRHLIAGATLAYVRSPHDWAAQDQSPNRSFVQLATKYRSQQVLATPSAFSCAVRDEEVQSLASDLYREFFNMADPE